MDLYAAPGCPFAQRSRAILGHLEVPFDHRVVDLRNKSPEFLALSPTGRVPLLLDGEAKLYESSIINEYLAERTGWSAAFSKDTYQRARERLAMLQFDTVLIPAFFGSLKARGALDDAQRANLERELDELERTALAADSRVNLLAFHVATHFVRWQWMAELTPLPALVAARPKLAAWLNELAAHPAITSTLPEKDATIALLRKLAKLD